MKRPIFLKFVLLFLLLIGFTYYTYFSIPMHSFKFTATQSCTFIDDNSDRPICSYILSNGYLTAFYIFYCVYFTLSVLQIVKGYKEKKQRNSMMRKYDAVSYVLFFIYKTVPFLFEIQCFMDWTFTTTALSIYQWIKLEEVH